MPALSGIRVLDLTHFIAGPYAATILADLGADVVKVEDPRRPDAGRNVGEYRVGGESLYYLSLNWGKRSIALNLESEAGRRAALALARTADVVLDNFRPGVMASLGLAHEQLARVNPRLITCSLTGFGETGPYATRPGYDYTVQALAGVMSLTGEPDAPPGKAGISYADHAAGLTAALAIVVALRERELTGSGRHVDLALFDVQVSMLSYLAAWQLNAGFEPVKTPDASHHSIVPAQNLKTADGYISLFVGTDAMWRRFAAAVGDPRLDQAGYATNAGRFERRAELIPLLREIFEARPTGEWARRLAAAEVPHAPVNTIGEAMRDEQVAHRGLIETASHPRYGSYRHVAGPITALGTAGRLGAPVLGEHTRELLLEAGYTADEIDALVAAGDVAVTGSSSNP